MDKNYLTYTLFYLTIIGSDLMGFTKTERERDRGEEFAATTGPKISTNRPHSHTLSEKFSQIEAAEIMHSIKYNSTRNYGPI